MVLNRLYSKIKEHTGFLQFLAVVNQSSISIIGLIRIVIVVRLLTTYDYGIIGLAAAVSNSFSVFQHLGLGVGVAKEAAQSHGSDRLGFITILVLIIRLTLLLPLILFLIYFISPFAAAKYNLPQMEHYIDLSALGILVSSPGDILSYVLTGDGHFKIYFKLRLYKELLFLLISVTFILFFGLDGYFFAQILTGFLFTIFSALLVFTKIKINFSYFTYKELINGAKSIFKTSAAVFSSKIIRTISLQMPVLLGSFFLSVSEIGCLKFGIQSGGNFATLMTSTHIVTMPKMTHLLKKEGRNGLFVYFSQNYLRLATVLSLFLILAFSIAPELVVFVGGSQYINSYRAFQFVILFYYFVMLADTVFNSLHFPLNREYDYLKSYIIYFIISIVSTILISFFYKSNYSSLFGICFASFIHWIISIIQTSKYNISKFFNFKISFKVFIVLIGVLKIAVCETFVERIMICFYISVLLIFDLLWQERSYVKNIGARMINDIYKKYYSKYL
jgi:O-antigen/teichoic acid export membrane protein